MFKKLVLGTLLVGLIGVLVFGAVNRTLARTGAAAATHGRARGENGYAEEGTAQTLALGSQGGRPEWAGNEQGREDAPGDQSGTGQAQVDEWLQVQGSVVSVDADALIVATTDGTELVVEDRPWSFAQEAGFTAQSGDELVVTGFFEGEEFEVGGIENVTTGQTVLLRDETGRPLWAGRGRRGG